MNYIIQNKNYVWDGLDWITQDNPMIYSSLEEAEKAFDAAVECDISLDDDNSEYISQETAKIVEYDEEIYEKIRQAERNNE